MFTRVGAGDNLARGESTFLLEMRETAHILRHASGRYGTTLQYLSETACALRERGVHDREIERLMALAQQKGLL